MIFKDLNVVGDLECNRAVQGRMGLKSHVIRLWVPRRLSKELKGLPAEQPILFSISLPICTNLNALHLFAESSVSIGDLPVAGLGGLLTAPLLNVRNHKKGISIRFSAKLGAGRSEAAYGKGSKGGESEERCGNKHDSGRVSNKVANAAFRLLLF